MVLSVIRLTNRAPTGRGTGGGGGAGGGGKGNAGGGGRGQPARCRPPSARSVCGGGGRGGGRGGGALGTPFGALRLAGGLALCGCHLAVLVCVLRVEERKGGGLEFGLAEDRKSTRLTSSH